MIWLRSPFTISRALLPYSGCNRSATAKVWAVLSAGVLASITFPPLLISRPFLNFSISSSSRTAMRTASSASWSWLPAKYCTISLMPTMPMTFTSSLKSTAGGPFWPVLGSRGVWVAKGTMPLPMVLSIHRRLASKTPIDSLMFSLAYSSSLS